MSNNRNPKENANERAERVVRTHVLWSMGAGFIPLPVADMLAVMAVQIDMIRQMSGIYDVDFKETEGKALISSLTGSALSKLGANALIKAIPIIGTMVGGISMAVVSGASTYAVGQVFKRHFEMGGTFVDFDTSRFRKFYDEQFEKGKKVAEDLKKEEEAKKTQTTTNTTSSEETIRTEIRVDDTNNPLKNTTANTTNPTTTTPVQETPKTDATSEIVRKLKELAELRDMGVISEEEFAQMKTRLIENYK